MKFIVVLCNFFKVFKQLNFLCSYGTKKPHGFFYIISKENKKMGWRLWIKMCSKIRTGNYCLRKMSNCCSSRRIHKFIPRVCMPCRLNFCYNNFLFYFWKIIYNSAFFTLASYSSVNGKKKDFTKTMMRREEGEVKHRIIHKNRRNKHSNIHCGFIVLFLKQIFQCSV